MEKSVLESMLEEAQFDHLKALIQLADANKEKRLVFPATFDNSPFLNYAINSLETISQRRIAIK